MLLHIVLFTPRADLSPADRAQLVDMFEQAHREIPAIRRFSIGRRVKHGAGYEALMRVDLEYAAVLEFDDLTALHAYLEHPAHVALGRRFMQSLESSAIYDYEVQDAASLRALADRS